MSKVVQTCKGKQKGSLRKDRYNGKLYKGKYNDNLHKDRCKKGITTRKSIGNNKKEKNQIQVQIINKTKNY